MMQSDRAAGPRRRAVLRAGALAVAAAAAWVGAASAQQPPPQMPMPLTPAAQAQPAPLSAVQLEALMTPLAGVPQQMLPAVLDACRYPADIMDAEQTLRQGGAIKPGWNTGVQFLARYSPDLLGVLARDIGATAQLGEAYTRQPNDVLRAYGAVELRSRQAAQAPRPRPPQPPQNVPPAVPMQAAAAAAPRPTCPTRPTSMHGAAGGAARGALIGELSGDPGRRAAMGGLASMVRRAAERRERETAAATCY